MSITRKQLLQGAAVATTAAVAANAGAALADDQKQSWEPEWTDEADLIVVGFGGSGVMATIAGIEAGCSVIALEKTATREGGNMARSGGQLHEVDYDIDEWYSIYKHGCYGADCDERTIRAYMAFTNETPEWFEKYDIPVDWTETKGDGRKTPPLYLMGSIANQEGTMGRHLYKALNEAATERDADVRCSTRAKRLVQNPFTKEICGVIAEGPNGETLNFKAHKAVIMACGGYENNQWMLYNYFSPGIKFYATNVNNTGDGFPMVTEVGAALWHMGLVEATTEVYNVPSDELGVRCAASLRSSTLGSSSNYKFIFVGKNAKRYCNEKSAVGHKHGCFPEFIYDDDNFDFALRPMFMIFDQSMFDDTNPLSKSGGDGWPSNEYAVEKGWIFKGETIEELAANIKSNTACTLEEDWINGIDADTLRATVADYNQYCEDGEDPEFGRKPEEMLPLDNPPFYAIELGNGLMNTNGGPQRNEYAQTLNGYGETIPRLYNTGEFGSFNGLLYNFGNLMEAVTTGRVAAQHAATLEAWDA
ncbi:MAG: FAD-binding protein [Coriobacteriales bacterium]|nr:FAD-binding protein [Coriobacteriales bacterium]